VPASRPRGSAHRRAPRCRSRPAPPHCC
jgi:hypothetical protein